MFEDLFFEETQININGKRLNNAYTLMNKDIPLIDIDEDKETLEGDHNDLMAIMVYLYIICDTEGYFEDAYKDTNKVPFFKFCVEDVGFETTMKDRTFRNRFDQLIDVYKKYCLYTSQKLNVKTEKDYQKVLGIFHGKKYFKKLREDMNC